MSIKESSAQSTVKAGEQSSYGHSTASARYESVRPLRLDAYDRIRLLLEWVGRGKRVLEVGCSTGYISRLMADRKCVVTGIEIDPKAAVCARRYCREVQVRDLNSSDWAVGLPAGAFDVVLLADVLEHLVDPARALREIAKLLDANGRLVVSLPNVVHWITRGGVLLGQFNYQPTGTLDHTHLRFFTVSTARELIESAGYQVIRFHPAIGGRMSGYCRPLWQKLAQVMPGLFSYQLLFEARSSSTPQRGTKQNAAFEPVAKL